MKEKSKSILGLRKKGQHYSDREKIEIIELYLRSGLTRQAFWEQYSGESVEHGHLLGWMRRFGYADDGTGKNAKFAETKKRFLMKKKTVPLQEDFETQCLKKRISELEKQVRESEMKALAFSTMVDIAEREFGIPIRKKFNARP